MPTILMIFAIALIIISFLVVIMLILSVGRQRDWKREDDEHKKAMDELCGNIINKKSADELNSIHCKDEKPKEESTYKE